VQLPDEVRDGLGRETVPHARDHEQFDVLSTQAADRHIAAARRDLVAHPALVAAQRRRLAAHYHAPLCSIRLPLP
jgi:hypothetical protein